jgi:CelD/BcsL family acetyltransferase involved in cellulose biosynthesis
MTNASSPAPGAEAALAFCLINPLTDPAWEAFASRQDEALIFHRAAWLELLRDQYDFKPLAACAIADGVIVAGLPICELRQPLRSKRWVSLPFSDRCGPIGAHAATVERLMSWTWRQAKSAGAALEVRDRSAASAGLVERVGQWSHVTNLAGSADEMLARLHPDVRRRIRKGQALGLKAEIRTDPGAMDAFYRLHLLTRRKHGVPIQPRRYFHLFQRLIVERGLGHVVVATYGGHVLSAGVFCRTQGTTLYKYGASDPAAAEMPANYLMFWTSMVHALESGCCRYDFGKTAVTHESLRFFKKKWATEESPLPYFYAPHAPASTDPSFVLTHVVGPVIRNSPLAVCRAAGEAFYKHFAA